MPRFEPHRIESADDDLGHLRPGGVHLITGGLGDIGLRIARHLAERCESRLVLVGRELPPEPDRWEAWLESHSDDDPISRKIRGLQTLEAVGAQVLPLAADVSHEDEMRDVLDRTFERFGALHGVIHAAGTVEVELLRFTDPERTARIQAAKVEGTLCLDRLLAERDVDLDFFVLFSSLAPILGGLGDSDYAGGNAFLDAFAATRPGATSVSWDGWVPGGAEPGAATPWLSPEEVVTQLDGLLSTASAAPLPARLVVTRRDLPAEVERWKTLAPDASLDAVPSERVRYPRPAVSAAFVAPASELERSLAELWQDALGIESVGVHDDFFELGGNSLLATQLVSRLRDEFGLELRLQRLVHGLSVAAIASAIEQDSGTDRSPIERIRPTDQLLENLDELSESEIDALLGAVGPDEIESDVRTETD